MGTDQETRTLLPANSMAPLSSNINSMEDEILLMRRAVDRVLADFEETSRQAFLRIVMGVENPVEIARALGMSVNAVYLAKSRIKRRIRQEFQELMESI